MDIYSGPSQFKPYGKYVKGGDGNTGWMCNHEAAIEPLRVHTYYADSGRGEKMSAYVNQEMYWESCANFCRD